MGSNGPIVLEVTEDGGVFHHGDAYDAIADELDEVLDARDGGRLTDAKFLAALKAIVARHPHFIDGHAHLGYALMEQGKPKLALEACLRGLQAGEGAIPPGFAGPIEWGFLENRPFLRAAHGVVLSRLGLGGRREALALMERMLAWNPGDNQGIRYLIGSAYLRAGKTAKAARIFENEADAYPPYHYELGLLHLSNGDAVAAATSLRRGFMANNYIAEILCGNPDPIPLVIWHDSNFAEPESAHGYVVQCGDLWRKTAQAIPFLHWLYTHPKVLTERAAVFACKEALLWEHDIDRRRLILGRGGTTLAGIDDRLSKDIVVERIDVHGQTVWPWLYRRVLSEL